MLKPKKTITSDERLYLYKQSSQISGQTGFIGYLRGDFGSNGTEFWTTWFPFKKADRYRYYSTQRPVSPGTYPKPQGNEVLAIENYSSPSYITEIGRKAWGYIEYKLKVADILLNDFELYGELWRNELDEVVNILRKRNQPLECLSSMKEWVRKNPNAGFDGTCCREYGLRVDSDLFTFMFRFIPMKGNYNFYCSIYTKQWFDDHLEKAAKGIRFITPHYDNLFRIPDGGKIRVAACDGKESIYDCRYIDEYHVQVGSSLYHICEFAELMKRAGATVKPYDEPDDNAKEEA